MSFWILDDEGQPVKPETEYDGQNWWIGNKNKHKWFVAFDIVRGWCVKTRFMGNGYWESLIFNDADRIVCTDDVLSAEHIKATYRVGSREGALKQHMDLVVEIYLEQHRVQHEETPTSSYRL